MTTAPAPAPASAPSHSAVMTADEFIRLHGDDSGVELDRGHLVRLPMPGFEHGEVCGNAYYLLREFIRPRNLGRVFTNDPFVKVSSDPDTFRGADVAYISYATLPADVPTPRGSFTPPLELVVEVRSPSDTVVSLTNKAGEYLDAGVRVVLVLDPESATVGVFRPNELPQRFSNGDEVKLDDVLPGFSVAAKRFFE